MSNVHVAVQFNPPIAGSTGLAGDYANWVKIKSVNAFVMQHFGGHVVNRTFAELQEVLPNTNVEHNPVTLSRAYDTSSVSLWNACAAKTAYESVCIDFIEQSDGGALACLLRWELTNVVVKSFSFFGTETAAGNGFGTEELELEYQTAVVSANP